MARIKVKISVLIYMMSFITVIAQPLEITEEAQKALNEYSINVLFDTGKPTIKSDSETFLIQIVDILNEFPTAKFIIEGHTDSMGRSSTNLRLSEARADTVKDYLIKNGIDSSRLTAKGYGESRPIATNATKSGRSQNRRIEVNLSKTRYWCCTSHQNPKHCAKEKDELLSNHDSNEKYERSK